jgi:hypothetical protein
MQSSRRDLSHVDTDTRALRALVQAAVDVELFTIPLYMSALYSVYGVYSTQDGSNWPGMRPTHVHAKGRRLTDTEVNQLAFNIIFTVFIQEMLHLQMAANLARALGFCPSFTMPTYGGTSIPCVGDLSKIPGYEDVKVEIGPLDEDRIRLFCAIETPDARSESVCPAVPFEGFNPTGSPPADNVTALPTFGTIGHLYECIRAYMAIVYTDGQTLWSKTYAPDAPQVQMFADKSGNLTYPELCTVIDAGLDPVAAYIAALKLIDGIIAQGEGGSADSARVPEEDQPDAAFADSDWAGLVLSKHWNKISHFRRFQIVRRRLMPRVVTFPAWRAARGDAPWTAELLGGPLAEERAAALNDPNTGAEANDALNHSVNRLLAALTSAWSTSDSQFSLPAMQALNTRAFVTWAAGATPSFSTVKVAPVNLKDPHACQGLSLQSPGNRCAAVPDAQGYIGSEVHTCSNTNACKGQGGCGYPGPGVGPGVNSAAGNGGCGTPIPVAQVMSSAGQVTVGNQTVAFHKGDRVADVAWKIYLARGGTGEQPTATGLRVALPPS